MLKNPYNARNNIKCKILRYTISLTHTHCLIIILAQTHHDPFSLIFLLFTLQCELNKQLLKLLIAVVNTELLKTTDGKDRDIFINVSSSILMSACLCFI